MNILSEAILFATKMHHGQLDKAGKPYIMHVLKVLHYTKSNDEEIMAIAVLHDVIEDCFEGRHEEGYQALKDIGMTKRVIDAVRLLTKVPDQTNEEYMEGIKTNIDAIRVKLADLRHNMDPRRLKGVSEKDRARIDKYVKMFHELTNAKAEEYDRITLHIQNSLHG